MRALIVDDARAMRSILSRMLQRVGFEVTAVESGPVALAALAELETSDHPDVMLVDWNMPEMDGGELVEAIRANSQYDEIRILMCTTETDIDHVNRAIQAGANEYIMKPFTEDVIREKLKLVGASAQ